MMARKTWALVGAMAVIAATAHPTFAMDSMKRVFAVSLGAGVGVPMGDFGDGVNVGPAGEFTAEYYVARNLAVGIRGVTMMGDLEGVPDTSDVDLSASLGVGGVSIRFSAPSAKQEPYLIATLGSGRRSLDIEQDDTTISVSNNHLGVDITGGVNFRVGEMWQVTTGVGYMLATKESDDDSDINWPAVHATVGIRVLLGGRH